MVFHILLTLWRLWSTTVLDMAVLRSGSNLRLQSAPDTPACYAANINTTSKLNLY